MLNTTFVLVRKFSSWFIDVISANLRIVFFLSKDLINAFR